MYLANLAPIVDDENLDVKYSTTFNGKYYPNSIQNISGSIKYVLEGKYNSFSSEVGVKSFEDENHITSEFYVYADGILIVYVPQMNPLCPTRFINVNITEAQELEIVVKIYGDTTIGQPVWLNPQVSSNSNKMILGALGDIAIKVPDKIFNTDKCIISVVDADFIDKLDSMLFSLRENGNCGDAKIVIFAFGDISRYKDIANKYNIYLVECNLLSDFTFKIKTAAMSVANIVNANKYLYLDADMLILDDIHPLFDLVDIIGDNKVVVTRELDVPFGCTLGDAVLNPISIYQGAEDDLEYLKITPLERQSKLIVNNGVYVTSKKGILGLEASIRFMLPGSAKWERGGIPKRVYWREQAIFNIAIVREDIGVEVDGVYNFLLNNKDAEIRYYEGHPIAFDSGKRIKILHFNGVGRNKYKALQSYYEDKSKQGVRRDSYSLLKEEMYCWYNRNTHFDIFNNINNMESYITFAYNIIKYNNFNDILIIDEDNAIFTFCAMFAGNDIDITSLLANNINGLCFNDNLNLLIGDIPFLLAQLDKKFDFIVCNNKDNKYTSIGMLNLLKKLLNKNGKILINNKEDYFNKNIDCGKEENIIHLWLNVYKREKEHSDFILLG